MKILHALWRRAAWVVAAWAVLLAGCTYYAPPPGPSTYDRAYNAMLGAMSDQGVKVTDANPASGLITGSARRDQRDCDGGAAGRRNHQS